MAALLLYRQPGREQYSMDGTIGEDLVVKPAPDSVRRFANRRQPELPDWDNWGLGRANSSRRQDAASAEEEEEELPVDYAFLDEDEPSDYNAIGSDMSRGLRRRREAEPCLDTGAHIVFRRRGPDSEAHLGDYSESGREGHKT
jgi:hypothetical protein